MRRLETAGDLGMAFLRRLRRERPCYGYIGWAGHGNLGDDAMHQAARRLAGDRIEVMRRANAERILHLLRAGGPRVFPHVFLGGGTLVNEGYLPIVEECLRQGLRISSLGTGVGSAGFSMHESSLHPRWIGALRRFENIGVRGPISLGKLERAGLERAEIVGDLALALTTDEPIADWRAKTFLFNVAPPTSPEDRHLFSGIFSSLARLLRHMTRSGWSAVPVCFDPSDREAIRYVLDEAEVRTKPILHPGDHLEYFSLASSAALSIGVRLHSAVMASCCGLPNILIGYRDKCADFAATVKMERHLVSATSFEERALFNIVDETIAEPDRIGTALHAKCANWKRVIQDYFVRVTGDRG